MCGKSMLGSLYLSILLTSCLLFDFGSANSSEEEIEGKSLLLKEASIREVDNLEKQWEQTQESQSKVAEDERDAEPGECVRNSDCSSDACDTETNRCYVYHSNYVCDISTHIGYYDTLDDAIDACNGDDQCGCVDYWQANNYQTNVGTAIKSSGSVNAWVKT